MFDLFRRKDTFMRYVMMGLLGLVAISMVWYLVPGSMTGGATRGETTIADIGGESLSVPEVSTRIEQVLRNSGMQRENAYVLVNNVVESMISMRALEYEAKRMGFQVTDADVAENIRQTVPQLFPNGQFVGKEVYASFLRQNGMAVGDFEHQVRRQILLSRLSGMVEEGIVVSPADIEAEYRRANDRLKIEYIAVRHADMLKQVSVTDAEVAAEYQKNKANLKTPEKRLATVYFVDEAHTAAGIQVSDADLRRAYDEQRDRFRTGERLHVRHILLKTTDKPAAEAAKIQAKAEDLLKQLKGGADFAALATKNSEDTTSAVKGGDLGWIVKGQTVKNFEDAAWSLKPKELSAIVKTEYGFHILQLLERQDARVQPFEEAKAILMAETQKQVVFDTMQRNIDNLRTQILREPAKAAELAQKFNAQSVKVGPIAPGQPNFGEFGNSPELAVQIFSTRKGDATGIAQGQGNRLAFAFIDDIQAERPATLEEVAGQIRSSLIESKAQALQKAKADEALAKAKAPGANLKKIAADLKLEYKTTADFNRAGAAEGMGSGGMVMESFGKPAGFVGQVVGTGDALFVTRVIESIPADITKLAQEREGLLMQLKQQRGRERSELFAEGLVQRLTKEGKLKIYDDTRKRLLAQYSAS